MDFENKMNERKNIKFNNKFDKTLNIYWVIIKKMGKSCIYINWEIKKLWGWIEVKLLIGRFEHILIF